MESNRYFLRFGRRWLLPVQFAGVVIACAAAGGTALSAPVTRTPSPSTNDSAKSAAFESELTVGFNALLSGNLEQAQSAFDGVLRQSPRHVNATLGLAEVAIKRGQTSVAEAHLKEAYTLAPGSPDVLVAYARYHTGQGRYDAALTMLRKAEVLAPGNYAVQRDLGELYLNGLKKPDPAIAAFERAIKIRPDAIAPRVSVALANLSAGRRAEARARLKAAAEIAPTDPMLPHMQGRIDASEKKFPAAIAAMDQALRLRPDFMPALSDRADIYAETNDNAKAVADYERMLQLAPGNATARLKLGLLYQRLDRLDDARKAYLAALELNKGFAVAYNNLASIALRRNEDSTQANAWAVKAVELSPNVPQFHDTLGLSYRALGAKDRALKSLEQAVRLGPTQAEIQFHLGQAYEDAGRKAEAIEAYKRALTSKDAFQQAEQARSRLAALKP